MGSRVGLSHPAHPASHTWPRQLEDTYQQELAAPTTLLSPGDLSTHPHPAHPSPTHPWPQQLEATYQQELAAAVEAARRQEATAHAAEAAAHATQLAALVAQLESAKRQLAATQADKQQHRQLEPRGAQKEKEAGAAGGAEESSQPQQPEGGDGRAVHDQRHRRQGQRHRRRLPSHLRPEAEGGRRPSGAGQGGCPAATPAAVQGQEPAAGDQPVVAGQREEEEEGGGGAQGLPGSAAAGGNKGSIWHRMLGALTITSAP